MLDIFLVPHLYIRMVILIIAIIIDAWGLTSCFSKLFTSLLQNRVHRFLDDDNLYNRFQAGFRPDYRTTDHIFIIKTILNKYLYKNKKQVFACFVDFSKVFDSLSHEALFQKLYTLGIKGIFFQLIHNMYTHAKFVVKKDHTITDPSILGKGVWQGDGLSKTHSIQNIY